MYVEWISLETVRTFVSSELTFVHPDSKFRASRNLNGHEDLLPKPRLPNVNLLLGDNGSGKTTILQAIALASLGPAARDSKLVSPDFVRLPRPGERLIEPSDQAIVSAFLKLQPQDSTTSDAIYSTLAISRKGELERIDYIDGPDGEDPPKLWDSVFKSDNDAFFCAAYGSTRRAESAESLERGGAPKPPFVRGRRLRSIFEDSFPLFPLINWLPPLRKANPGRFRQVVKLINLMLGAGHYRFTGQVRGREYLFERGGIKVPFRSLSDGYRSFIAWVGDLLYHVCYGCPKGKKLRESVGVVLVDEIDLHLHPKWQMKVIGTVARALPRMQFIFTSHSPLVVGSLEWMNIITLKTTSNTNRTSNQRLRQSIHGLDADQILLTDFFGLKSTIAPAKRRQLDAITARIRSGDRNAPLQLIKEMSAGTEEEG